MSFEFLSNFYFKPYAHGDCTTLTFDKDYCVDSMLIINCTSNAVPYNCKYQCLKYSPDAADDTVRAITHAYVHECKTIILLYDEIDIVRHLLCSFLRDNANGSRYLKDIEDIINLNLKSLVPR